MSSVSTGVRQSPSGVRQSPWMNMGLSSSIVEQLEIRFPHIQQPTPAQKLFLLAVMAGREVFLKDDMGRGKTLGLAIAALNQAVRDPATEARIVILVPTPHLAHQVCDHLTRLSSASSSSSESVFTLLRSLQTVTTTTKASSLPIPDTPIIVATPKVLAEYDLTLPHLTHIFLDEPDTMTGQVPPRYTAGKNLAHHRINRHPPPIVDVMNRLLGIKMDHQGRLDFTGRRDDVTTIWTSATMGREFKRFVKTRGWVKKGKGVVDLDFTEGATDKQVELRERLLSAVVATTASGVPKPVEGSKIETGVVEARNSHAQSEPEHYALVIDPDDGAISPLDQDPTPLALVKRTITSFDESGQLSSYLLETLALLHATSPPPSGAYALALPPEGVSLDQLGRDLSELGVSTSILTPEVLQLGLPPVTDEDAPPILLAQRSSLPGLHLNELHTIYLLSGLDCAGLSPSQKKSGGVVERMKFYNLVVGRLGRLGTTQSGDDDLDLAARQKVVSVVMRGSEEEKRLKDLFFEESHHGGGEGAVKRELKFWNMDNLNEMVENEVLAEH
nr:uncharacterized protein CI109_002773 [Kwoniella shandongensis]KAA5529015.1 hypothetical protein CI109_002773 [Kwoniella shandongensis]